MRSVLTAAARTGTGSAGCHKQAGKAGGAASQVCTRRGETGLLPKGGVVEDPTPTDLLDLLFKRRSMSGVSARVTHR